MKTKEITNNNPNKKEDLKNIIVLGFYDECVRNQVDDDLPLQLLFKIANKAADDIIEKMELL